MLKSVFSHRFCPIAFLLVAFVGTTQATPLTLHGISFSPYVEGNSPGGGVTEEEIDRLLREAMKSLKDNW